MRRTTFVGLIRTAAVCCAVGCAASANAWDAHGHRTITRLAIDTFAAAAGATSPLPDWITSDRARAMIAYESAEPDRYRATKSNYLAHENNPEHYLDVEDVGS